MASTYYDKAGKEVNDGDIIYADDLNDVNMAIDTAFQQVEVDISTLTVNQPFYADLAQKWAENPEDTAVTVDPDKFSALHWAAKAEDDAITAAADALTATTQAGIATTQAGAATTQAGIATTQAGISTTKAGEAAASAAAALASETDAESAALEAATYLNGKYDYIIDGDFNYWVSASYAGLDYGGPTMYDKTHVLDTHTISRQSFTIGQTDVPGELRYFCRNVVVSGGQLGSFSTFKSRIEDVRTLSGKTATLSFYAKADSSKSIGIIVSQYVGTGGSGSAVIKDTLIPLTSSWQKITVEIELPTLSGATIGGSGDDQIIIQFFLSANTVNPADAPAGMIAQSGTFDFARIRLVEGTIDGNLVNHTVADEGLRVARYYQTGVSSLFSGNTTAATQYVVTTNYFIPMRSTKEITLTAQAAVNFPATPGVPTDISHGFQETRTANATASGSQFRSTFIADARM